MEGLLQREGLLGTIGLGKQPADGRVDESPTYGALNSAVECHLHTVEVIGSNPVAPTIKSITYKLFFWSVGSFW
jgi:hypothetical protein